jgi:glycosyltransferase involved in cell wall biosynthesis
MKISLSATNPCHLYAMARELAALQVLGCYYSGYPAWKLPRSAELPLRTHSWRTNIVYGLLKFVGPQFRPSDRNLFLWQDHAFDRWVGAHLEPCDFIHAMPGQALQTFRAAKQLGIQTVLNHATGPVREWVRIMEPEYARAGLQLTEVCHYDKAYFEREEEEYRLSDWHCAASSVVREQLIATGIDPARIWTVPYGADPEIFSPAGAPPPEHFRIVFAGQLSLRKDVKTLLQALTLAKQPEWEMHFYGGIAPEAQADLASYTGATKLHFHGSRSQGELAEAFRGGSVLVLPSLEEGFGLVVPQALSCGLPVIASDRVGAKDLLRHRENGSIFPARNAAALAEELAWWCANPRRLQEQLDWSNPARMLTALSKEALSPDYSHAS